MTDSDVMWTYSFHPMPLMSTRSAFQTCRNLECGVTKRALSTDSGVVLQVLPSGGGARTSHERCPQPTFRKALERAPAREDEGHQCEATASWTGRFGFTARNPWRAPNAY